ncbi:SET domain-containing protein [Calocera cornea HHB12733]|uniref:SET domain-containing protein n=1 Tax=Calocera cornea HHB12733 TaxID=1353952 RepID=A0A165HI26_9BASI|nr:SET domain-containing protein [Calocera cornea HHB12733]
MRRGFLVRPRPARECVTQGPTTGPASTSSPSKQKLSSSPPPPSPRRSKPFEEADPIHRSVSLLPLGASSSPEGLVISFRSNLELLLAHPWVDRAFLRQCEAVELRAVEGKGLGLVVPREVGEGEVLVRERPLLVIPEVVRTDVLQQFEQLLEHLPLGRRQAFGGMHNVHPTEGAFGVHRTNCVGLDFGSGMDGWRGAHAGTFEWIGRANHSCAPGAVVAWDGETLTGRLVALRPMSEGEEVRISYLSPGELRLPTAERRRLLWEDYRFVCECERCGSAYTNGLGGDAS